MQVRHSRLAVFSPLPQNQREFFWVLLLPLSLLWTAVLYIRRNLGPRKSNFRAGIPVICVGNIHSGGSAKTPIVAEVVKKLGVERVAVIARGYGGSATRLGAKVFLSDADGPARFGDEPWMLAQKLKANVYVGSNRERSIRLAEAAGSKVAVMDDGFQHLRVARDVDLVCLNTDHDPSSLFCLPLGPLRESIGALRFATAIILTSGVVGENAKRWEEILIEVAPCVPRFTANRRVLGFFAANGESAPKLDRVGAFCGIASPARFWADLGHALPDFVRLGEYADHQAYTEAKLSILFRRCREAGLQSVVTTEKDAPKVERAFEQAGINLFQLRIEYELSPEFWYFLTQRLESACFASS